MENEEIREQPLEEPANVSGETIENRAVSENGSLNDMAFEEIENFDEDKELSPESNEVQESLGKFRSVQALLDAYNNLQASYTKKCQRLSELEKDKAQDEKTLAVDKTQFEEKINEFLSKNTEAQNYAEELKQKVLASGSTNSSAIEDAWKCIVLDHFKAFTSADDKLVDKYVLDNENVRNKIIQDYINSLNKCQTPIVISSGQGQRVSDISNGTPATLSDAKKALERMFN